MIRIICRDFSAQLSLIRQHILTHLLDAVKGGSDLRAGDANGWRGLFQLRGAQRCISASQALAGAPTPHAIWGQGRSHAGFPHWNLDDQYLFINAVLQSHWFS